ncbi:MAG: hypothetical protein HOC85_08065 [Acidiferrobacteraceae bacterium]|nr:hypothetical protein [Acidiferrobacteraceae bacterium]
MNLNRRRPVAKGRPIVSGTCPDISVRNTGISIHDCKKCWLREESIPSNLSEREVCVFHNRVMTEALNYHPHETVHFQGGPIDRVYTVPKGWFILSRALPDGSRKLLKDAL